MSLLSGLAPAISAGAQGYFGGVVQGEKERQRRAERQQELDIRGQQARGRGSDPFAAEKQMARHLAGIAYSILSNPEKQSGLLANPQLYQSLTKSVDHLTRVASGSERLNLKLAQPLADLEQHFGDQPAPSLGGGLPPLAQQQEEKLGAEPTAAFSPSAEGKGLDPDLVHRLSNPGGLPFPLGLLFGGGAPPAPGFKPTGGFGPGPGEPNFKTARVSREGKGEFPAGEPPAPLGPPPPKDPAQQARQRYDQLVTRGPDMGNAPAGETPAQASRRAAQAFARWRQEVEIAERQMMLPNKLKVAQINADTQRDLRESQITANRLKVPESQFRIQKGREELKGKSLDRAARAKQQQKENTYRERALSQTDRRLDLMANQLQLSNEREKRIGERLKSLDANKDLTETERVRLKFLYGRFLARPSSMFGMNPGSEATIPDLMDSGTMAEVTAILTEAEKRRKKKALDAQKKSASAGQAAGQGALIPRRRGGGAPVLPPVKAGTQAAITDAEWRVLTNAHKSGELSNRMDFWKTNNPAVYRRSLEIMKTQRWKSFTSKGK